MNEDTVDALAAASSQSYEGFAEASRGILEILEPEIEGSALFVAHLDEEEKLMRIIDTGGEGSFGLAAGAAFPLEDSFCVHMAAGRSPQLSNDSSQDPNYAQAALRDAVDIKSYVGVPLETGGGKAVGSLCAISHRTDSYGERDLKLLQVMGKMLARELERELRDQELQDATERLREIATSDSLTGLINRRGFDAALKREWELAANRRLVDTYLVIGDLDGLKPINDQHGHAAGDEALRTAAGALSEETRGADIIARIGGDEFAALLVGCASTDQAETWCRRVRERVEAQPPVHGAALGISFGYVSLRETGSPEDAFHAADQRMYEQKRGGRSGEDQSSG